MDSSYIPTIFQKTAMKLARLFKPMICIALWSIAFVYFSGLTHIIKPAPSPAPQIHCELVILADSSDPYHPLAEEIAAEENAPMVHTLSDALACQPVYLLWVVTPAHLSDAVMVEFGLALKEYPSIISSGIITGSTIERARGLWEQRTRIRSKSFYAVNAANPAAHIEEGRIIAADAEGITVLPLTINNFENVLSVADYLTFTGHGSGKYLRLD
ncbi:MAG TPA: hypothetical protein VK880_07605, partial [Anaerolineales bacterium]|nr:hypothetical protein [Anaerolineales bacterium]